MKMKKDKMQRLAAMAVVALVLPMMVGCPATEETADQPTTQAVNDAFKPTVIVLADDLTNPDGMTLSEDGQIIYLNVPNLSDDPDNIGGPKSHPPKLVMIDKDDKVIELMDYPPYEVTGECGPMGLDIGPDGHLYVCDNQFFLDKNKPSDAKHLSRILRVLLDEKGMPQKNDAGEPTIEVVAEGLDLANALLWLGDAMYVTDTFSSDAGDSVVWRFTKDEVIGNTAPVVVKPAMEEDNPHVVARFKSLKVGRGDIAGADGMTADSEGNIYCGNFGDGAFYKLTPAEDGTVAVEQTVAPGEISECVDGIFFCKTTGLIYINDSEQNAIRTYDPKSGEFAVLWMNDDSDGADGSLDQPCECVVRDGKLYVANFDRTFPGLKNTKNDDVYTLSVIDLQPLISGEVKLTPTPKGEPSEEIAEEPTAEVAE